VAEPQAALLPGETRDGFINSDFAICDEDVDRCKPLYHAPGSPAALATPTIVTISIVLALIRCNAPLYDATARLFQMAPDFLN